MSTRKLRLSVFATVIVLGVLLLFKTLHYSDDFQVPAMLSNDATQLDPLVSSLLAQIDNGNNIKVEPNTKLNTPAGNLDESTVKDPKADIKGSAKDLTEEPGKDFNPAKEFNEILLFSPVVIFSKTYCPYSKNLKSLLKNDYELIPEPIIVELDKHKHGKELQDYIAEKSGRSTVPNLYVNGVSRGGSDDMKALHDKGELLESLTTWGGKALKVTKHSVPSNS